ncbi:Pentatricopeptide repeat-containing protein [Acorus gramineus]|uniref:Pentatricopeptide repeat-containing protein n=1 Tax=Acorus gramineus TaxID=55184 RepID=A0AAV9ATR4_ACOGR|nr:Pentatricopeptide repeat-containing protein [Acorus gramineus]
MGAPLLPQTLPKTSLPMQQALSRYLSSATQTDPTRITFSRTFQHCSDLALGTQAHARMIVSGFAPTVFVNNCLLAMYARCCSGAHAARAVFDRMPERDTVSHNVMVSCYARSGIMGRARSIFDSIPDKDVVSWNSIISGYAENGLRREPLDLFVLMRRSGMSRPDRATLAIVLRLCADSEDHRFGRQVHGLAMRMGLASDVVTGSAVLDMYAKCESFGELLRVFREMPERNSVSWSAAIAGCVRNDRAMDGLDLFVEMRREGVGASQSAYASLFRLCAGILLLDVGRQIHGEAVKTGFTSDPVVGTSVLDMYAKCDRLRDAERAFRLLPKKNLQTWNAMVVAFVREDLGFEALELFRLMNKFCVGFDDVSLSGVFSACAGIEAYLQGLEVHGLAIKTGFMTNICVANAMLDMYGKCGAVVEACNVFDDMERRDGVSWNAIITALEQNGRYEETLFHFNLMLCHKMEPDEFTYGSVLKACGALESADHGSRIHDRILKSGMGLDMFVGSAIIDMYCKCGCIEEALKLHERMEEKSMVSWNAIISGFTDNKRSEEAQKFFSEFLDTSLKPDKFTFSTVLDTCANLATVVLGKQIHAQIIKQDLQMDVYISSTLVDMYSKCGNMEESLMMFQMMQERDLVSWNAIISGDHSKHDEIYIRLDELIGEMKRVEYCELNL